jgi:hypothetical protein
MDRYRILRLLSCLCVLCVGMVCGCTKVHSTYSRSLNTLHRHAEVFNFDTLRAELIWDAVLVTPDMREARLHREAELRHVTPRQARERIPPLWWGEGTLFYVNFFAPRDAKDLLSSDGYWRVELQDASGVRYSPMVIEPVLDTPLGRKLFPFGDSWSKAYLIQFPSSVDGDLQLTLYGLNATSRLKW